jgi:serine/threonine protein kinase
VPFKAAVSIDGVRDVLDREQAGEASGKLAQLYEDATERLKLGLYGLPGYERAKPQAALKSIRVGANVYFVGPVIARGNRCNLYLAYLEREERYLGEVVIKLVENIGGNLAAKHEISNLAILHNKDVPQWKHLPLVLDRFQAGDRLGIVLRKVQGASLARVREHGPHKNGVDQRDMVWILGRMLSCLGYVHHRGIVHGCVNAQHIMLNGPNHNAYLVGWGNAVHNPAITGAEVEAEPDDYTAPEVRDRGKIGPWSDIYSLGKVMIRLLGGDTKANEIPGEVEPKIRDFILRMVKEDPYARSADAWELHREHYTIVDALWERKFRHFPMPEIL